MHFFTLINLTINANMCALKRIRAWFKGHQIHFERPTHCLLMLLFFRGLNIHFYVQLLAMNNFSAKLFATTLDMYSCLSTSIHALQLFLQLRDIITFMLDEF